MFPTKMLFMLLLPDSCEGPRAAKWLPAHVAVSGCESLKSVEGAGKYALQGIQAIQLRKSTFRISQTTARLLRSFCSRPCRCDFAANHRNGSGRQYEFCRRVRADHRFRGPPVRS